MQWKVSTFQCKIRGKTQFSTDYMVESEHFPVYNPWREKLFRGLYTGNSFFLLKK